MSSALDSITAATKLRRAELDVQRELEAKRQEYNRRMAQVKEGEAQLAADRADLQDTLVQYYKFIQENEIKRSRAMKKVAIEEKQRKEREVYIAQLTQRLQGLESKWDEMKTQYRDMEKYQAFLEEILSRNDGDEYQEPRDIIKRWMTLCDNTRVLQERKTQLEEDLLRTRSSLNLARQRRSTENIALQNRLNEMQMSFESLQKSIKAKQDKLDRKVKQKSSTTRTVSHVSMATANLYDRCMLWTRDYSGRGRGETANNNVLHQLHAICDCLEDFQTIIMQHQEQQRQAAMQQAAGAATQQGASAKAGFDGEPCGATGRRCVCRMSFQPICVLCLSDCDRGGGVTSCNHYLCSRCTARLPTAAPCPLCQRPYQLIKLDHPNVQQLLQDGATALERTEKVIGSQMRHYQQVIRRMRQALAALHSQNQEMTRRRQREQAECAAAVSRAQALQAEVCRLREGLTRASSKRAASQQQPPPLPPSPPQQRAHVMPDPRVTHDSDGHPHNAPNTLGVCHTPSAQIIPPPLSVRHAPFAPTSAVGAKAPDTFSRGSWQRSSGASSPSLSSHPQWQHRRHHLHGNGGEARDAAVESAPPLGWSASSLIAKRHRADSDPSLSQGRVGDVCVSLAQPGSSSNAGRNVALTPRTHALASLQHQLPHQSSRAAAWGPGNGDGSDSAGPRVDFRLTTPLAAALHQQPQPQPQPSHPLNSFMQAGTSYMLRPSLKPHQRLFSSPRDGPVSL